MSSKTEYVASLWCPLCDFYIEVVLVFPEPEEMKNVETQFLCPACNQLGIASRTIINLEDKPPKPELQRIHMVPDEFA